VVPYPITNETQAGLNLNLFGALSGVFSGKSDKMTDTKVDGSSCTEEKSQGVGKVRGEGGGSVNALAAAKADAGTREMRAVKGGEGGNGEGGGVDHLGLEGGE